MAQNVDRRHMQTRKTRIVCISDTHNQTPKLPKGDILIHAGDLSNQGSYSELKRTVEWLEKADFEAKIVVAGNHDITLDEDFYRRNGSSWRWPRPQVPEECKRLFTESTSLTYLENEAACIFLTSTKGPRTCFKVFGSPCTPKVWNWAFQYEENEAQGLWDAIPSDTDIVVAHTPPQGHCDKAPEDTRSGCKALLQALERVRPMLSIAGHIHGARGVERVRWNTAAPEIGSQAEEAYEWRDPGAGSNRQSLVDLTGRGGGRPLENSGVLTRQSSFTRLPIRRVGGQMGVSKVLQPGTLNSTSDQENVWNSEAGWKVLSGGSIEHRVGRGPGAAGVGFQPNEDIVERRETCMINAAFLGPRTGGPKSFNKPIVVDVNLPVWDAEHGAG